MYLEKLSYILQKKKEPQINEKELRKYEKMNAWMFSGPNKEEKSLFLFFPHFISPDLEPFDLFLNPSFFHPSFLLSQISFFSYVTDKFLLSFGFLLWIFKRCNNNVNGGKIIYPSLRKKLVNKRSNCKT